MVELLDALPDAVCIVDKLGLIVQANSYFCKNIAKAERTVGISLLEDLIHQTDRDKLGIAVRQASSTGDRVVIGRCRTMTFEGANEFPVFRQYEWVVSGGVEPGTVIASGRLVGAKERIVQEVEQEEELLDFFQNAPIALHWLSDKGIIIWANNTELQTLGYSAEEYIGQPVMKFCPDEEELVLEIFKQLGTGNTIKDVPVRFRTKNGDIRYLLIDSNVNYNVDGSFRHTRCFIRDDTSRIVREGTYI
jgi:PAS domain S-box-containing protein